MRTMKAAGALGLAAGLLLLAVAGEAQAHGGRFVVQPPPPMPGDKGPPYRDPYAPPPAGTPPTRPSTPAPPTKTPQDAPTTTPKGNRPRTRSLDPRTGWREWWEANEEAIRAGRRMKPFTTDDGPLFRIGGREEGNRSDAERPTRRATEVDVLPVLRALVDAGAKEDPDVIAASALAIGKLCDDPDDVRRLVEAGARRGASDLVRESALLALGLLRRSPADERFPARVLDGVRERLFEALDDDGLHVRARCFAALALGLLGDQPSGDDDYSCDARQTVRGLWTRLLGRYASDDLPVAMLSALSLQPRRGIPDEVKADLRTLAVSGRLGGRSRGPLARAHAVLALARLDGPAHAGTILGMATNRSFDSSVRRAAASGLGMIAGELDAEQRAQAVAVLLEVGRSGDPEGAGLALVTVGRLLHADFAAGSGLAAERSKAADALLRLAEAGPYDVRPFAALALALAGREAGSAPDVPAFADLHARTVAALREGAASERTDPDTRGAFCVAVGMLGDGRSAAILRDVVARKSLPEELRGFACAGLGLLGRPTPEARAALRGALAERSSDELRRQAARALGLLGDTSAVASLVEEIEAGGPDHVVARLAVALGDIGDVAAVRPLVSVAQRRGRVSDAARAIACAALGLVADLERPPSLSRLGTDGNPLVRTDALAEALSLL